ncbi:MAG: hypothetical protein QXG70_03715, partial [Candidatus Methanomethylicaceae archaeon]
MFTSRIKGGKNPLRVIIDPELRIPLNYHVYNPPPGTIAVVHEKKLDDKNVNLKELAFKLKSKLACGGTEKNGRIELQGDHREKVMEILIENGFSPNNIEVL